MANQYEVQPEWRMFLPEEPEGESSRQRSVAQKVVDTVMALDLKNWAKSRAKQELQANSKVKALRDEILGDLRQKYAQEDQGRTEPLTPVETALRAREWAQAREQFNPHPWKEPVGINQHFSMPTRNPHPEMEGEYYKRGKENVINKVLGKPLFADVKDGIHLYDDREGVIAAMQIAQQRYGGSFGVQGGGERFRSIVAANAIMLDIPLKGEEMQRRVDGLRGMIDKEKEKLLLKDKWKQYVPEPEPERQAEPVVEQAPDRAPVKVVEMTNPMVYDASRYVNRGEEVADEVFPAVKVTFVVENEGGQVKLDYDSGKNPGREFSVDGRQDNESARVAAELARLAGINLDEHADRSKIAEVQKMYDQMKERAPEKSAPSLPKVAIVDMSQPEITSHPVPSARVTFILDGEAGKASLHFNGMANNGRGEYTFDGGNKVHPSLGSAEALANRLGLPDPADRSRMGKIEAMWQQHDKVHGGRSVAESPAQDDHLFNIAKQLESGAPAADPNVPGHVGYNSQGDNVCAINDQTGRIRAWGIYGNDGKPLMTRGEDGWKEALTNMAGEALKKREAAREASSPEHGNPSKDIPSVNRDM